MQKKIERAIRRHLTMPEAVDVIGRMRVASELTVLLDNGSRFEGEIKAYSDPITSGGKDVSVIKIDGNNLPTVPLGDSVTVNVNDHVYVIGYPGAAEVSQVSERVATSSDGIISAVKNKDYSGTPLIQTNANINHGNSGGPAFDASGKVIGIATGGGVWLTTSTRDKEPQVVAGNQGASTQQTSIPEDTGPATDVPVIPNKPRASKKQLAAPLNPPDGRNATDRADAGGGGDVPAPVVPPPAVAGQELSGTWQGTYADSRSPQHKTLVRLQLKEVGGEAVAGTLKFTRADNSAGQCDLSKSTYSAQTQKLQLLLHCSGPAPGYFNTPTSFSVSDPTERSLTGRILYSFPGVTVDIRRE